MKYNPKVSIIIPVYNAERFLNDCLDSVLKQTYDNIEIILVDDGSIDNSLSICLNIEAADERVKVISSQNRGPSSARNIGIKHATGSLIQFIDSDDLIARNMVSRLVEVMHNNNNDLVVCGYKIVYPDSDKKVEINRFMEEEINIDSYRLGEITGRLFEKKLLNSCCNKMYKKDIIVSNEVKFNEKMKIGEDLIFNIDYLRSCKTRISITKDSLYLYLHREIDSLTRSYKKGYFENQLYQFEYLLTFLKQYPENIKENQRIISIRFCGILIDVINNLYAFKGSKSESDIITELKEIVYSETVNKLNHCNKKISVLNRFRLYLIKKRKIKMLHTIQKMRFKSRFSDGN